MAPRTSPTSGDATRAPSPLLAARRRPRPSCCARSACADDAIARPGARRLRRAALPAYLGALALATAALVAWMLLRHSAALPPACAPWLAALAALLMLFPASEAVVAVINRLISESARPAHLPRLALGGRHPARAPA